MNNFKDVVVSENIKIRDAILKFEKTNKKIVLVVNENFKLIDDFAHHPTAIDETIKMAKEQTDNLILIIELGSNSMKKGIHDERLLNIFKNQNVYTINASANQRKIFANHAQELTKEDVAKICTAEAKKKTILMCGNRNFQGFQKLILDELIK